MAVAGYSSLRMVRMALDHAHGFVRHSFRYNPLAVGERRRSRRQAVKRHRRMRSAKSAGAGGGTAELSARKRRGFYYWAALLGISLLLVLASFSFVSKPDKFFSKSRGIHPPDMIGFLAIPAMGVMVLAVYYLFRKRESLALATKTNVRKIRKSRKKSIPDPPMTGKNG